MNNYLCCVVEDADYDSARDTFFPPKESYVSCLVKWTSFNNNWMAGELCELRNHSVRTYCAFKSSHLCDLNRIYTWNAFAKHGCRHLGFRPAHGAPRYKYKNTRASYGCCFRNMIMQRCQIYSFKGTFSGAR